MEIKSNLTYDAEGRDEECKHMHWPGGVSGVTIGHGYDLGHRRGDDARDHFEKAGIGSAAADVLVSGCGLTGDEAKAFVTANKAKVELTHEQMVVLFNISFDEQAAEVVRISEKPDCIQAYGKVDFNSLDSRIWLVLVDLKFRGDYYPGSRKRVQAPAAQNDLEAFTQALEDRDFWNSVPPDRFNRRVQFLRA